MTDNYDLNGSNGQQKKLNDSDDLQQRNEQVLSNISQLQTTEKQLYNTIT